MEATKLRAICAQMLSGVKHRTIGKTFHVSCSLISKFKDCLNSAGISAGIDGINKFNAFFDIELVKLIYPSVVEDSVAPGKEIVIGRPKRDTHIPDYSAVADKILETHVSIKFCYTDYLDHCIKKQLKSISRSDFYDKVKYELVKKLAPKTYMMQHNCI